MTLRALLAVGLLAYSGLNIVALMTPVLHSGDAIASFLIYDVLVRAAPEDVRTILCMVFNAPLLAGGLGLAMKARWASLTIGFAAGSELAMLILAVLVAGSNAWVGYSRFPYLALTAAAPAAVPLLLFLLGSLSVHDGTEKTFRGDWVRIDGRAWLVLFTGSLLSGPIQYEIVGVTSLLSINPSGFIWQVAPWFNLVVLLALYVATIVLLKKWWLMLLMVAALPFVAGSVFIALLLASCNSFHDCL